jgi:hypothetical protein
MQILADEHASYSYETISLYQGPASQARERRRLQDHAQHVRLHPPDLVTKLRVKRRLHDLESDMSEDHNGNVRANRARTSRSFDCTGQDLASILDAVAASCRATTMASPRKADL